MLDILSQTIETLLDNTAMLLQEAPAAADLHAIIERGEFRPAEDEAIGFWIARFLSLRESLWTVIEDVLEILDKPLRAIRSENDLRYFLIGYAAVWSAHCFQRQRQYARASD